MAVDDELLNRITWKIPNALALVGSRHDDEWNAMTTSWITQLSMEPVLIGVAVDNAAVTHRLITDGGSFTVNLWSSDDTKVFVKFSKPATEDDLDVQRPRRSARRRPARPSSTRRSPGSTAKFATPIDYGTHTLFVGEPVAAAYQRRRHACGGDERHPHEVRRREAPLRPGVD